MDSMSKGEKAVLDAALDRCADLFADNIKLERKVIVQRGIIVALVCALILRRRR